MIRLGIERTLATTRNVAARQYHEMVKATLLRGSADMAQQSLTVTSSSSMNVPCINHQSNPLQHIQKRTMFIQTASTPNPESIKFLPGRQISDENGEAVQGFYVTATEKDEISKSPLCQEIFKIEGVKSIYLTADSITITKYAEAHWPHIKTPAFSAIMDFYATGEPAVSTAPKVTDTTILDTDSEVVAMIKELLESRIRPAVNEDGGDIRYVGFDEVSGVVTVQLAGSCVGCPSSSVTLKNGVENMLMHYIPEVTGVVSLEEEGEDDGGDVDVTVTKAKTYEERLAAAGIPFSD